MLGLAAWMPRVSAMASAIARPALLPRIAVASYATLPSVRIGNLTPAQPKKSVRLFSADPAQAPVSYTHLTLPTNREV